MCDEIRIVFPMRRSSFNSSRISMRARGSRPELGSSISRTFGSWISTRATASRCCMPRESPFTSVSVLCERSVSVSTSAIVFSRLPAGTA